MLDNRQFDLEECVEECVGPFREQGEADGKVLDVSLQAADTRLIGDPFRVQQILNNLLSNAFKFTPAGGKIRLEVTQLDPGRLCQVPVCGGGYGDRHVGGVFEETL